MTQTAFAMLGQGSELSGKRILFCTRSRILASDSVGLENANCRIGTVEAL